MLPLRSFRFFDDGFNHIQVDPWAGLYLLNKGEDIEILAESETTSPRFDVDENGRTTMLTIIDSSEYYVVRSGQRVFWTEYYLDHRLCTYCLQLMESEEESGKLYCTCEMRIPDEGGPEFRSKVAPFSGAKWPPAPEIFGIGNCISS